jgi:hypothetical protein
MAQQVQWGIVEFIFDNEAFQKGFMDGRRYYFEDCQPEEVPTRAITLTACDLLHVVAVPDHQGHYHLDDGTDMQDGVEELLGVLIGYMSGPLLPETSDEEQQRLKDIVLQEA